MDAEYAAFLTGALMDDYGRSAGLPPEWKQTVTPAEYLMFRRAAAEEFRERIFRSGPPLQCAEKPCSRYVPPAPEKTPRTADTVSGTGTFPLESPFPVSGTAHPAGHEQRDTNGVPVRGEENSGQMQMTPEARAELELRLFGELKD